MEKLVMCFPGQGSQQPNMAIDLYDYSPKVKSLFQMASDISHLDLYKILKEGDAEILKKTEVAQNAIALASLSSFILLKERGLDPIAVAGFSLGELMALRSSCVIDDESLFNLIYKRSSLMALSSDMAIKKYGPVAMAAIIGLNVTAVEKVLNQANINNIYIANDNSDKQVVISGVKEGIEKIVPLLKENGAKRVVMLKVSGPFHTPLLKEAEVSFNQYLETIQLNKPKCALYSNVTGQIEPNIEEYIAKQITNRVQWTSIMKDIKARYEEYKILEVGVSKTLTNLFKTEKIICRPCGTVEQIEGL